MEGSGSGSVQLMTDLDLGGQKHMNPMDTDPDPDARQDQACLTQNLSKVLFKDV
jgi:hypothetical protein